MIDHYETKLAAGAQGFEDLKAYALQAAQAAEPIHEVEQTLWTGVLRIGLNLLHAFVLKQGPGDVGPTLDLPDGSTATRLPQPHVWRYVSVFGELPMEGYVYGTRESQKILAAPLAARLHLPDSPFSYLLQDWDQSFCVGDSFSGAGESIQKILGLDQSVRSLIHMNQSMAQQVEPFRLSQPPPPVQEEGQFLVVAADCKGVPIRRERDPEQDPDPKPKAKSKSKGKSKARVKAAAKLKARLKAQQKRKQRADGQADQEGKPGRKRMACVGAAYTIDPFVRTAEDIIDEVLRDERQKGRPLPQHKRVRADLSLAWEEGEINGKEALFPWLADEIQSRLLVPSQRILCLLDGERALLIAARCYLPPDTIYILDLFHVLEKLRRAAHCFHAEGSADAEEFVEHRLRMLLEGKASYVVSGLRQMVTKQALRGKRKKTVLKVCHYLHANLDRLQYDEYIRAGYPIGSGAVEGACRHLVKDRLEGTGMRWRPEGAQAMLNLRAIRLNGDWQAYCEFRIKQETQRLYPYAAILDDIEWPLAA